MNQMFLLPHLWWSFLLCAVVRTEQFIDEMFPLPLEIIITNMIGFSVCFIRDTAENETMAAEESWMSHHKTL